MGNSFCRFVYPFLQSLNITPECIDLLLARGHILLSVKLKTERVNWESCGLPDLGIKHAVLF